MNCNEDLKPCSFMPTQYQRHLFKATTDSSQFCTAPFSFSWRKHNLLLMEHSRAKADKVRAVSKNRDGTSVWIIGSWISGLQVATFEGM